MQSVKIGLLSVLFASNAAFAGTPELSGGWSGSGISLLPDGSTATSEITLCIERQDGGLFAGSAISLNTYLDGTVLPQLVCGTGHIATDKRVTAAFTPPPGYVAIPLMALFDGKWTGRGISGVVRDPSDGGTSEISFAPDPNVICPLTVEGPEPGSTPFISEIHYDNISTDVGEAIEVTRALGTPLTGYSLVLYSGADQLAYNSIPLEGAIPGEGVVVIDLPVNGLQNGPADGIALVDGLGNVVEFLSYEGSFTAADGPAAGLTSSDIGVSEPSDTEIGHSLQLVGGIWTGPDPETFGSLNEQITSIFSCVVVED